MKHFWYQRIFGENSILFLNITSLLLIIVSFLLIQYKINPSSETMALHYNVLTGVDELGPGTHAYRIPGIALVLVGVNFLLGKTVRSPGNFLSLLFAITSFAVSAILVVAVLFILRVN